MIDLLTAPLACLLCGRPPRYAGVFVAKDQRRVGAPPGKVRVVRYSLCKKCVRKSSTWQRVEERLLGDCDALERVN